MKKDLSCPNTIHLKTVYFTKITDCASKILACNNCIVGDTEYDNSNLVELRECIDENKSKIIKNWPPRIYFELYNQLVYATNKN